MIVPALGGDRAEVTRSKEPSIGKAFRQCPRAKRLPEVQASHGARTPARAGAPGSEQFKASLRVQILVQAALAEQ